MDRTKLILDGAKGLKAKFTAKELKSLAKFIVGVMGKDSSPHIESANNLIDTAYGSEPKKREGAGKGDKA